MYLFHLNGEQGHWLHAVLCAAGYNIKWMLRVMVKKGFSFCGGCICGGAWWQASSQTG